MFMAGSYFNQEISTTRPWITDKYEGDNLSILQEIIRCFGGFLLYLRKVFSSTFAAVVEYE